MASTTARILSYAALILAALSLPGTALAASSVGNLLCLGEEVLFNPGNGEDIVVPKGFKVSVFAKALNFPTEIALRGNAQNFEVYVVESGGLTTVSFVLGRKSVELRKCA